MFPSLKDGLVLHGYGQRSEVLGISPLVHHAIAGFGLSAAALVSFVTGLRLLLVTFIGVHQQAETRQIHGVRSKCPEILLSPAQ
jgi:hypothetical protein